MTLWCQTKFIKTSAHSIKWAENKQYKKRSCKFCTYELTMEGITSCSLQTGAQKIGTPIAVSNICRPSTRLFGPATWGPSDTTRDARGGASRESLKGGRKERRVNQDNRRKEKIRKKKWDKRRIKYYLERGKRENKREAIRYKKTKGQRQITKYIQWVSWFGRELISTTLPT